MVSVQKARKDSKNAEGHINNEYGKLRLKSQDGAQTDQGEHYGKIRERREKGLENVE